MTKVGLEIDKLDDRYGEIAEIINAMIPEDWMMVKMYTQIIDDSSMIFFYYYPTDGSDPVINLEIPGRFDVDKNEFRELKLQLWQQILSLSEAFEQQHGECWTNFTWVMDAAGKFTIDYGYEDLSDSDSIERRQEWEERYIFTETHS